jgi:4-amino-4-deoxy-L-arabinose transferase-like glycosyltransferase
MTRPWWREHGYHAGIGIVALVALTVRLLNVLRWRPTCIEDMVGVIEQHGSKGFEPSGGKEACFGVWGDAGYYYVQGRMIAKGHWFIDSYGWFASGGSRFKPSSGNPPLFTLLLGLLSKLGITSGTGMRVATSFVGVAGVILLVTLVRKLVGPRAAIIAGLIAAVYPMLWINDGMLLSETLYVPMILIALHAAYRFWERRDVSSAAVFGLAMALAALTRGEALILLGVMVLPLLWGMRELGWGRLARMGATTYVVGALVIAPWILFNLSRFEEPVLMTSSTGAVLSSANCDITYYGESIGYFGNCYDEYVVKGLLIGKLPECDQAAVDAAKIDPKGTEAAKCWPNSPDIDESQRDKYGRDIAIEYMKTHKRDLPRVMAARVGRMWDVYVPELGRDDEPLGQNVRFNWQVEGRGKRSSEIGVLMFYALMPLAIGGGVWLWRRRVPLSPLLSMTIVITVTSAFTFGITRYRVPVDIMVVVMAAAGIEGILQRWWPRRDGASLQRLRRGAPAGTIDGSDQDPDPDDPAAPLPPDAPADPPTEALVHG